jgi:hypothetical protein
LDNFYRLKDLYQQMGAVRFLLFFGGLTLIIAAYAAVMAWLSGKNGWPTDYGFSCRGRGCLWVQLYHSPMLLRTGRLYELLLFAWLWLIPGATSIAISVILSKRWLLKRKNSIRAIE